MFSNLFKRNIVLILLFSFVAFYIESDDILTIYSHNPLDVGGQLVEIIDVAFYEDGVIKYVKTYRPNSNIRSWEDDNKDRNSLNIAWHFDQYNVIKENNSFTVEALKYDENYILNEAESDHNYSLLEYNSESNVIRQKNSAINIFPDSSFQIVDNESNVLLDYQVDAIDGIYKYLYTRSKNFYEYSFSHGIYSHFKLRVLNKVPNSFFKIDYNNTKSIYTIRVYDRDLSTDLFSEKYIIRNEIRKLTNYASCINYLVFPPRLRILLPFVTNTPINQD